MGTAGRGLGRGKGRAPGFDREYMASLYERGKGADINTISIMLGCAEITVIRSLKKMGVWVPPPKGRPRQEFCQHGHEQKVWRRVTKDGRGFCGKCKTNRDKGYEK